MQTNLGKKKKRRQSSGCLGIHPNRTGIASKVQEEKKNAGQPLLAPTLNAGTVQEGQNAMKNASALYKLCPDKEERDLFVMRLFRSKRKINRTSPHERGGLFGKLTRLSPNNTN